VIESKTYDGSERRRHCRITYNPSQRPSLKVQNYELEVVDISEGGFRIISNSNVIVFDKSLTCGTIILLGGDSIDLEGDNAWDKGDEIGLKFRNLLPSNTIQKEREKFFDILIERISSLPKDWHLAGSVSRRVLNAIVDHAREIGPVENSVETGSGKSTLLFSHLSKNHVVFALENGNKSISSVKRSELFNANNVTYIEGPTQKTLPRYVFNQKFDIALIDGPHAYPFPDLEYYYFYPNLIEGGLLLLDDIQIPSIRRMFEIIKGDHMFELLEVLNNMAFFRRTDSPLIDPYLDGWWLQGYNRLHYEKIKGIRLRKNPVYKILKRTIPEAINKHIPNSLKRWIRRIY
jgi:hypothetical protein